MKKSILIGLGLAVSIASTAIAQSPDAARGKGAKGKRGGEHGQMEGQGRRGGRGPDGLLLKGITLTEGQRSQIAQVDKAQREAFDAKRKASKDDLEKLRDANERGDTTAIRLAKEKRLAVMQQERAQHIAAIRNILTAEQRVQFDKNVAELKARNTERAQKGGQGRGQRGDRAGRPQGQQFGRGR